MNGELGSVSQITGLRKEERRSSNTRMKTKKFKVSQLKGRGEENLKETTWRERGYENQKERSN